MNRTRWHDAGDWPTVDRPALEKVLMRYDLPPAGTPEIRARREAFLDAVDLAVADYHFHELAHGDLVPSARTLKREASRLRTGVEKLKAANLTASTALVLSLSGRPDEYLPFRVERDLRRIHRAALLYHSRSRSLDSVDEQARARLVASIDSLADEPRSKPATKSGRDIAMLAAMARAYAQHLGEPPSTKEDGPFHEIADATMRQVLITRGDLHRSIIAANKLT